MARQSLADRTGTAFRAYRAGQVDDGYMVRLLTAEHRAASTDRTKTRIAKLLRQYFPGQYRYLPNGAVIAA